MGNDDNKTQLNNRKISQSPSRSICLQYVLYDLCQRLTSQDGKALEVFHEDEDALFSSLEEAVTSLYAIQKLTIPRYW